MHTLEVATANLRCDMECDGIYAFPYRKDWIVSQLRTLDADLYGFQEVQPHMQAYLADALPEYGFVGCGRQGNLVGEAVPVAYRRERFVLTGLRHFWHSLQPGAPGSTFGLDQSGCPRFCTVATLYHKATGKTVRIYNTHLDHEGNLARILAAAQIRQDISLHTDAHAVFVTGDFNDTPDSDCIAVMVQDGALLDASADVGPSFHGYGSVEKPIKIDYVFTLASLPPIGSRLVSDRSPEGVYFSDHDMVTAEFKLCD